MMSLTVNKDCVLYVSDSDNKKVKICGPVTLTLDKAENGHTQFKYVITESILKNKSKPSNKSTAKIPQVVAVEAIKDESAANEKGDTQVAGDTPVAMETDSVCTSTDELQVVKNAAQSKLDDKMADEER